MRSLLASSLFILSVSAFAQIDTLTFWNGEYMVVKNDSVVYPAVFVKEQSAEFAGGRQHYTSLSVKI